MHQSLKRVLQDELLLNHYKQFRRFLPTFWHTLTFKGLESEATLLEAVQFLKELEARNLQALSKAKKQPIVAEVVQDVITPDPWTTTTLSLQDRCFNTVASCPVCFAKVPSDPQAA